MKKIVVALMLGSALLSGCSLFHSDKPWKDAKQENPLEIPPNMNRPNVSDALSIPSVNADQTQPQSRPQPVDRPGVLHLPGDVETAYKRVGLALGSGDIGSITGQSDSQHTYQVAMASKMQIGSSKGFLERHFSNTRDAAAQQSGTSGASSTSQATTVQVQIKAAAGGGSDVTASGDPQQVVRVMTALKARLGG